MSIELNFIDTTCLGHTCITLFSWKGYRLFGNKFVGVVLVFWESFSIPRKNESYKNHFWRCSILKPSIFFFPLNFNHLLQFWHIVAQIFFFFFSNVVQSSATLLFHCVGNYHLTLSLNSCFSFFEFSASLQQLIQGTFDNVHRKVESNVRWIFIREYLYLNPFPINPWIQKSKGGGGGEMPYPSLEEHCDDEYPPSMTT